MAAEFVRLVSTATGQRRLVLGNLAKLLADRRATAIESVARRPAATAHPLFHAPLRYYLVPFALSSKVWQGGIAAPSALLSSAAMPATAWTPMALTRALNGAYRRTRRIGARLRADLGLDETHASLVEATQAQVSSGRRRRGEMAFPVGTSQLLLPAPGDAPRLLRELATALRQAQPRLPLTWRLYGAFGISLIHPFADGNGRVMRAFAAAPARDTCATGALSRAIAVYLQGRQRLWNFTVPLALRGEPQALWDHFERCVGASAQLADRVDAVAQEYQERCALGAADLRGLADKALIAAAVLSERQFVRLVGRCSPRTRSVAENLYRPGLRESGESCWINTEAQHLVDGITSSLITQL